MNERREFEIEALESLRFDGEPRAESVLRTKEMLMKSHAAMSLPSPAARRWWIGGVFVAALGVGAAAGPRMLEWWEHIHVVVDEPLPGGAHHVVLEDDAGNTVLDTTLQADEALFQIEPDESGEGPILQVSPSTAPPEGESDDPR